MNIRTIDVQKDRQTLLAFHCVINYESASPATRKAFTFEQFHDIWMNSRQTETFLSDLLVSQKDPRTIAEIWEDGETPAAYIWVKFTDWPEYHAVGAEIMDIMVAPAYQRRGFAGKIMERVERLARERGANLIRSGTGAENLASQGLHAKLGFKTEHIGYEKEL